MTIAWTANYSYPDIPLEENFDHAEIGLSIRQKGFTHLAVDLFKLKFAPNLSYKNIQVELPNMVFLRAMIIRNDIYQNLKSLENSGTVFLNDIDAHYQASNKIITFKKLENAGIPIPKTLYLKLPFDDKILDEIEWPCVVKWMHGYGKIGVEICETPYDLYRIIKNKNEIAKIHKLSESVFDTIIIQKLITNQTVIQVHSVGNIHHAVIQFHPHDRSFKSNLRKDVITLPYKVNSDIQNIASGALKSLNLDSARMDIMIDNGKYKICEINPQASHSWITMTHLKNMSDILVDHLHQKMLYAHQRNPISSI